MSDYLLNATLKHVHNEATYTPPANTYLSLYIGNPLIVGVEVSGGGYARQPVTWAGVTAGTEEYTDDNSTEIMYPGANADWGEITHAATYDALTSGNMLEVFELAIARDVVSGEYVKVNGGTLNSTIKRESI